MFLMLVNTHFEKRSKGSVADYDKTIVSTKSGTASAHC